MDARLLFFSLHGALFLCLPLILEERSLLLGLSRWTGSLFADGPLLLGPTALGWEVTLAALSLLAAVQVMEGRRWWLFLLCVAVALLLLPLQVLFPSPWFHLGLNLLLAALFVRLPVVSAAPTIRPSCLWPARRTWVAALALLLFFGLGLALLLWPEEWTPPASADADGRARVLIWEEGLMEMSLPVEGRYGQDALGVSFGYLRSLLDLLGYETATAGGRLTPDLLDGCRVLVVMNLLGPFSDAEQEAVWRFVSGGGSLLVLGDHTNVGGTLSPMNRLLSPAGIRIRFDSAIQDGTRLWRDVLLLPPHPANRTVRSPEEVGIVVGASLDLPRGALPLITARRGVSDLGDEENEERAYLGNMRYDPGEQRGDLVLAAQARHGRGRVIVFGDTSTFQTSEAPESWRFIAAIFRHLADPHAGVSGPVRWAGGLLLVAAFVGGLCARGPLPFLAGAAVLLALMVLIAGEAGESRVHLGPAPRPPVAWVDASHAERIGPETWHYPDTIGGLLYSLMRAGYDPLVAPLAGEMDLRPGDALVVIAPARRLGGGELRRVLEFCREGGSLFLAVGYEERHGSLPLLEALGIGLEATPLSGAGDAREIATGLPVRFYEAWPLAAEAVPGMAAAETLVEAYGRPLAVRRPIGKGAAVVIGDTWFFSARNLEDSESFVEENVTYVPRLFAAERGGMEEAP